MSSKGCHHLQTFKRSQKSLDTFKWIHMVFVVSGTPKTRKTKICNSYCRTCKKRGPMLHACLECVYFGCHKHIREHTKSLKHTFSLELTYGHIHCASCGDYVYDTEIDEITMENKMQCRNFKRRFFESTSWDATKEERDLLLRRTEKVYITPESTAGLRGLMNLGATCFMNCIVQVLMHTPFLRDYFLTERHRCNGLPGTCAVCEVSKLFQEFYGGATVPLVLPELLHLIWTHSSTLASHEQQQDAHEFFMATLDILHKHFVDAIPKLNNFSNTDDGKCPCIIDQIFTGSLQSDLVCQQCSGVSTKIEPTKDFSLDLGHISIGGRQPSSLYECLEKYTRAEHLTKIMCSNCGSCQESTKQLTLKTLPIVVTFQLKRVLRSEGVGEKISTKISFPEMLDMTPFMSRSNTESCFPSDNRYSLFAVINHDGISINGGHYTAYVRQQGDIWYQCDDPNITRAHLNQVLNSEAYLLFYHKHVLGYE